MNLLVVGGLLVLGLLVLIGAVLLSLGEKSATAKASTPEVGAVPGEQQKAITKKLSEPERRLPAINVEAQPLMLNGQVHELATELRTLHQQTIELGQRLSVLTEIADHLEEVQAGRVRVKEDQESVR